jgi:hypothetical protein
MPATNLDTKASLGSINHGAYVTHRAYGAHGTFETNQTKA